MISDDSIANPKLKLARLEIEAILHRHDIGAFVVLHANPGSAEVFLNLSPSYSRVTLVGRTARLRSRLDEYNGDRDAQARDLMATANMVHQLAEHAGNTALTLIELSNEIDALLGAEHTGTKYTPDAGDSDGHS